MYRVKMECRYLDILFDFEDANTAVQVMEILNNSHSAECENKIKLTLSIVKEDEHEV